MTTKTKDAASQFIELWQQQLSAMTKDPEAAGRMMSQFHDMQHAYLNWIQLYATQAPKHGSDVSGNGNPSLNELRHRLAECETRIAALEQQLKG